MAADPLISQEKKNILLWTAIILLPFLSVILDFYTGILDLVMPHFEESTAMILYYPVLLLPSIIVILFLPIDAFAKIMTAFCLTVLCPLPLSFLMMFLSGLKVYGH